MAESTRTTKSVIKPISKPQSLPFEINKKLRWYWNFSDLNSRSFFNFKKSNKKEKRTVVFFFLFFFFHFWLFVYLRKYFLFSSFHSFFHLVFPWQTIRFYLHTRDTDMDHFAFLSNHWGFPTFSWIISKCFFFHGCFSSHSVEVVRELVFISFSSRKRRKLLRKTCIWYDIFIFLRFLKIASDLFFNVVGGKEGKKILALNKNVTLRDRHARPIPHTLHEKVAISQRFQPNQSGLIVIWIFSLIQGKTKENNLADK